MSDRLKSAGLAALSFTLSAGLLAAALSPATANASPLDTQNGYERFSVSVATGDLDLTSVKDQRRLERRIRNAARDMCEIGVSERLRQTERLCRENAVQSTSTEVAGLIERAERLAQSGQSDRASRALAMTDVQIR